MKKQDWALAGGGMIAFVLLLVFEYSGAWASIGWPESAVMLAIGFLLALYRPVTMFFVLLMLAPLETFSFLPDGAGLRLRPYQLLTVCLYAALVVRFFSGRLPLGWFRLVWADWLLLVFGFGSLGAALTAVHPATSLKQAAVVWSFFALYFLVRYFVRSGRDVTRALPFAAMGSVGAIGFALWQAVWGALGRANFEVMAGRPNGPFTEADWLGLFSALGLSVVLAAIATKSLRGEAGDSIGRARAEWTALWLGYALFFLLMILSVTRSAWLASALVVFVFCAWLIVRAVRVRESFGHVTMKMAGVVVTGGMVMGLIAATHLTPFLLGQRAASTGGWQTITIACAQPLERALPQRITSVDELSLYGCRHITLETIDAERQRGNLVTTVERPDPNVSVRAQIYAQVREVLQAHPVAGIGWGSVGDILGRDAQGNALNASNIFLEVWLGAGLIGGLAFAVVWLGLGALLVWQVSRELFGNEESKAAPSSGIIAPVALLLGLLLSWVSITMFDLFNSGILLGFVWIWLAVAVSMTSASPAIESN